jgi:hypothetical protein
MHTTSLTLEDVNTWLIGRLPEEASQQLPSRSQVMLEGTINDAAFQLPVEPDGKGGHWLHIGTDLAKTLAVEAGDSVTLQFTASKNWPEPELPQDVASMLAEDHIAKSTWDKATPMAHWEWLRWINATLNPDTRTKRIEVSRSKLTHGMRRPCCFNRAMCCIPAVSKSGVLITV